MISLFKSSGYPILQNRVYKSKNESLLASLVDIDICINEKNFISNRLFDENKMVYDENYDNTVPSEYHKKYYSNIINHLFSQYLKNPESLIIDIGCGKGNFLIQMFEEIKFDLRGIGIDPSYEGNLSLNNGKLNFIKEYLNKNHLNSLDYASLIVLRHTLEHIYNPENFLSFIFNLFDKNKFENIPIFIEVPDVDWIFENQCYWDFFYEHVNYFSKYSLFNCIQEAGGKVISITNNFGGQYLWAEALINPSGEINDNPFSLFNYINTNFNSLIGQYSKKIKELSTSSKVVVWGMSSKGIIYSLNAANNSAMIDLYVDINENKQNKFIPKLGNKIISPFDLPKDEKLSIICMNPNYYQEIDLLCNNLNLNYQLFNPEINKI